MQVFGFYIWLVYWRYLGFQLLLLGSLSEIFNQLTLRVASNGGFGQLMIMPAWGGFILCISFLGVVIACDGQSVISSENEQASNLSAKVWTAFYYKALLVTGLHRSCRVLYLNQSVVCHAMFGLFVLLVISIGLRINQLPSGAALCLLWL